MEIIFLSMEEILHIQAQEAALTHSPTTLRDREGLESAVAAPQASFEGNYLMDIFGMAATYVVSIAKNHPFIDGNKRAAAATALVFLFMNGYEINEAYEEELADQVLGLLAGGISKEQLADYFRKNSQPNSL